MFSERVNAISFLVQHNFLGQKESPFLVHLHSDISNQLTSPQVPGTVFPSFISFLGIQYKSTPYPPAMRYYMYPHLHLTIFAFIFFVGKHRAEGVNFSICPPRVSTWSVAIE